MGITSFEEQNSTRLAKLEAAFDSLIAQDKPGSKKFGAGRIPFGGASGVLTDDANLVWDNTNKRLGIGDPSPSARLTLNGTDANYASGPHIEVRTGADIYQLVQLLSFTHDNINLTFDGYYDGNWRSSDAGSNFQFRKQADALSIYYNSGTAQGSVISAWLQAFVVNNSGATLMRGPVQIRDNGFSLPAKTALHVSNSNSFGLRVAASTAGGAMVQNPLTTNAGFARGFFGHNAIWNDSDSLWYIDNIGASDATGILIPNGGGFEFINVASIGAASQTKSMANFRAAALATLAAGAIFDLKAAAGELRVNATRVVTARQTGWAAMTGTAARTAAATHTAQTISNPPTQTQVQNIDNSLVIVAQRLKALIDDLHATAGHGLIGA